MTQFVMTSEKEKFIAEQFEVKHETVSDLFKKYTELNSLNKKQYLAHIMRSLEEYIRIHCEAPFFRITCRASSENPALKGTGCASYKKKQSFNIIYDSQLEPKAARVVIAHELGHLFWITLSEREFTDSHEPLSSIFGIFTIMDKNDFYAGKTTELQHDSWQRIVTDFKQLKNNLDGKLNVS